MAIFIPKRAAQVINTPTAPITSTTVQAALNELDRALTAEGIIGMEIVAVPGLEYHIKGHSSDGGLNPDASTQTSIDLLLTLGVPLPNIVWRYLASPAIFVMPSGSYAPVSSIFSLIGVSTGYITIPTQSLIPIVGAPTLVTIGMGAFSMPSQSIISTITVPTLQGSGGPFEDFGSQTFDDFGSQTWDRGGG